MTSQYSLGPVKPLTQQAVDILGPMFGITTVYGWRKEDPFPDHPSGQAADFMVPNSATGDALAQYAIEHADELGVKYIVWNRRSWNPTRGTWENYTSTDNPHTDHVHITFKTDDDGSLLAKLKKALPLLPGPLSAANSVVDVIRPFGQAGANLINPMFWRRIGGGFAGGALIVAGLLYLGRRPIMNAGAAIGRGTVGLASTALQGAAFGAGAGFTSGERATRVAPRPPQQGPRRPVSGSPFVAPVSGGGTYRVTRLRDLTNLGNPPPAGRGRRRRT